MNCASNIITANFSGGKTHATTARVYQWSRGIELCITGADNLPQTFKAHFSVQKRGGVATTIVGIDERVDVPNVLFAIGKDIHVWLGASETEDDAEILYTVDIPVAPAPMPEYYDAEDTGVFDAVVEQVADYAATATAAANSAGASATAAAGSASAAAASASSAAGSAGAAEQARDDAVTAKGQAETAEQTATEKALQTAQNASQAALDAGRAESAAERAESAETGAGAAKTAAEAAAQNAAASAATADEKATLAGQSATAAAGSASAAAQSAASIEGDVQIASQKASEAQTAAGQAVTAKEAAQTAQQGAETAATNAGQSASTATAKAAEAATSASNAAQSKTDAEAAATRAEQAAATLTVDTALSDSSTNPVQNKVVTAEITDVKTALNALASDNAITASVNAVEHSSAYTERMLTGMTFIGGNTYILSLKFATAGWGYCYLRVLGSDGTTRYFNQGIDLADQPGCKFLFKPDVDIYNAYVVVIRPAAVVDTITVSVECIDPSLYDLVVNDWQENLYVDYDATVGRLMTTGAIEVTDINRTSDFIPVSGKDYLTYQIWNPIPEGDATKNWTAICFYDSSKNLVGARRTTNIAAQEHEVVTIKVPETAMFARVAFLFRSLDYKCMITYGVYTPAYRKSRTDIIHDAESYTLAFDPDTFYNGTLYPDGNPHPNDARIYSDQYYHVNAGDRLLLDNTNQSNPVQYTIYFYNENQEYLLATQWSSARVYKFESSGYIRILLRFANIITIQLSDIAQMVACVKLKRSVQDQIDSMEGKIRSIETQDDFEHDDKYRLFSSLVNGSGKSEGFVFFTDPHLFPEGEVENMYKRFATYTDEIASSYYKTATSFCVCGGDWLTGNASKDNALYKLNLVTAHMKELFRDKFYNVYGNHDDNAIGGGPGLTAQEVVNVLFPYSENAYYTFKEKYGRFYVFDSGTDQSPDMNAYRWTQIDWFAHQLIENDDPYSAVLLHIVWNINSDASIAPLALNINTIIGAYNSHTTVTANGITYDFTGCTGKVYFILGGHGHIDKSDTTTYNVPVVIRKNTQPAEDRYATAYDLVYVDWTGGKLYFVRIGYRASTSAEAFDI